MSRPPFPEVVDSSMLADFRACPESFRLKYLEHWKPKALSVHLHAGKAYADGCEAARKAFFEEGLSEETAVAHGIGALLRSYGTFECPEDSPKSADRMAAALEYMFSQYPMATDPMQPAVVGAKRAIEFSFAEPVDFRHPETGNPILYAGRFDQVVEYAGALYGFDDKTGSSLGASWSKQWDLRSQFTAYCWGARAAGYAVEGFIIRGIAILKTKFDTQQAISYRPQWQIDRWYDQVLRDLTRMQASWESGAWDFDLSEACNSYGGCGFRKICLAKEPESWLESEFERRRWDPVLRIEEIVNA